MQMIGRSVYRNLTPKKHLEIGSTSCCSRQNRPKVQQKLQINKHLILRLCKKMAKKFTD